MKIDGIDPLLLNRIKDRTERMEIQKSEGSPTDTLVNRESGSDNAYRWRTVAPEDQNYERRVEEALRKLNDDAEKDGLPLRFKAYRQSGLWKFEVFDVFSNEVVKTIETEQALQVVNRIQSLFGVLLDESR